MVCSTEWYIFVALLIAVVVRLLGHDLAPLIDAALPIVRALHPDAELPAAAPSDASHMVHIDVAVD